MGLHGADHIFPITDAGIGFTAFCDAAKNCNQRILYIESDGGLPYRSIHIGVSVSWDFHGGCMDAVVFGVKRCTLQESRY